MVKWGVRLLSWVLLYAGTYALFQPLLASRQEIRNYIALSFKLGCVVLYLLSYIRLCLY